jgi:hypothetical protein
MNNIRKGMILSVLRHANGSDCTNGGISSRFVDVVVVGPGIPEIFEEKPERPAVMVDERMGYKFLRPVEDCPSDQVGYMFGGNFAFTTDSRWKFGALPIHDRSETVEHYRRLSF